MAFLLRKMQMNEVFFCEGGEPIEANDPDDIENIDYNNYKGIYASRARIIR